MPNIPQQKITTIIIYPGGGAESLGTIGGNPGAGASLGAIGGGPASLGAGGGGPPADGLLSVGETKPSGFFQLVSRVFELK
jgi:hypothetical protein